MSYLGHTGYSRCADLFVSLAPLSHPELNQSAGRPEPGFNFGRQAPMELRHRAGTSYVAGVGSATLGGRIVSRKNRKVSPCFARFRIEWPRNALGRRKLGGNSRPGCHSSDGFRRVESPRCDVVVVSCWCPALALSSWRRSLRGEEQAGNRAGVPGGRTTLSFATKPMTHADTQSPMGPHKRGRQGGTR